MKASSNTILRVVFYGAVILLLAAVVIPNYMKTRWTSGGMTFHLNVRVLDDATGEPVSGAGVIVYHSATWPLSAKSADANSATTGANGRCQVQTHFPGSGRGNQGRLHINQTVFVRADGYEPWEKPCPDLLGEFVDIKTGPDVTHQHDLEVRLRKVGTQQ